MLLSRARFRAERAFQSVALGSVAISGAAPRIFPQSPIAAVSSVRIYSQEVYDKSWLAGGYPKQSCWGCRFAVDVIARLPFHTVLDAGTGNGALVRMMRAPGQACCRFANATVPVYCQK